MITLEQVKTLINGLKLIIPPFIKPDLNENDEKSPNFVKGRTHWEDSRGVHRLDKKFLPKDIPQEYLEKVQSEVQDQISKLSVNAYAGSDTLKSLKIPNLVITNPPMGPVNAVQTVDVSTRFSDYDMENPTHMLLPKDYSVVGFTKPWSTTLYLLGFYPVDQNYQNDKYIIFKIPYECGLSELHPDHGSVTKGYTCRFWDASTWDKTCEFIDPLDGKKKTANIYNPVDSGRFRHFAFHVVETTTFKQGFSGFAEEFTLTPGFYLNAGFRAILDDGRDLPLILYRIEASEFAASSKYSTDADQSNGCLGYAMSSFGFPHKKPWDIPWVDSVDIGEYIKISDNDKGPLSSLQYDMGPNVHNLWPGLCGNPNISWIVNGVHEVFLSDATKDYPYQYWNFTFESVPRSENYIKFNMYYEERPTDSAKPISGHVIARDRLWKDRLPKYSSAAEGSVLKIVNGVPTWVEEA